MIPKRPLYVPPPYQDSATRGRLILRDGSTATIHTASPEEAPALAAFFKRLSPESRRRRFFTDSKPDESAIHQMCDDKHPRQVLTMIVNRITEGEQRIIATGSYFRADDKTAEVAVTVDDAFQGKGLGTLLLERLALLAIQHGFTEFKAITDAGNKAMLEVFRHSGFAVTEEYADGFVSVEFSVLPGADSVARTELRDRLFTAASMRPFFNPQSVAVVGASRNPASLGYRIVERLLLGRFQGGIYPIDPKSKNICSMRAYPTMRDLPEPVDLAIIVEPSEQVINAVDDCAARGVRTLIVISGGFAETGADGRRAEDALLEKVRGYGMRMIGPNCLGLLNTDLDVSLNASFSPVFPPCGTVSISSESGALGLAILTLAKRLHLGLSTFVSIGNKADVSGNDLLQYWEGDDKTNVILLYMETIKNPRRFARIARRVSRRKPIVCIKGGRAAKDTLVDALFHQTGVLRSHSLEEMFDLATALSSQPLPEGRRVAVITNAGGPGILCSDTCKANGLVLPDLEESTQKSLREFLPPAAVIGNPIDINDSAPPEHFSKAMQAVLLDENVDMVMVIYIPVGTARNRAIDSAIENGVAAARTEGAKKKPILACMMLEEGVRTPLQVGADETIPVYAYPESAARVMSKVANYADWLRETPGMIPEFTDIDPVRARDICRNALHARGTGWLTAQEARDVLRAFKLPVGDGDIARTADEAAATAAQLGFPVAVKLVSHTVIHKSDMGGVALGLSSEDAVRTAFRDIRKKLSETDHVDDMEGVLVQPMVRTGVEIMVSVNHDALFGPLVAFGLAGMHIEILADRCHRVTPLSDRDAEEMIREIRGHEMLEGYRGLPPADIEAIKEILLRISLLVEEIPEIADLELNPIFALEPGEGCHILDARIRVEPDMYHQPAREPVRPDPAEKL